MRPFIPAGETVGFLTNVPAVAGLRTREHYLAQYMLAPVIVVPGGERPLVIGDFYATLPPLEAHELQGLAPVVDLGSGLVLLRRVDR